MLFRSGVGKTSIVQRFVFEKFEPDNKSSCGAGFICKTMIIPELNTSVAFKIWDTAGQERYHSMASMYYQDAAAAVVVYDTTNEKSFYGVKTWIKELKDKGPPNILIVLVGNKSDLVDKETVRLDIAQQYASEIDINLIIISAKEDININETFEYIAKEIRKLEPESPKVNDIDHNKDPSLKITKEHSTQKKTKTCC